MRADILPLRPVLRDFLRNLWYLRFFLFLILIVLLASSLILVLAEGARLDPQGTFLGRWGLALGITLDGFLFNTGPGYAPLSPAGRAAGFLNSLMSYILLGILIWVVEQSLSGHKLERARFVLFPRR